jgi:hypothetical protein
VFTDGLVKLLGPELAMEWPKILHLPTEKYHGGIFEGNACRKLVKSSRELVQIGGKKVSHYAEAIQSFDALVDHLFSSGKVKMSMDTATILLEKAIHSYMQLDITVTLKVHVVFCHLFEVLDNSFGYGLGLFSAQAIESSHREFLHSFWSKYQITSLDNPRYGDQLLKATIEFSSKHK